MSHEALDPARMAGVLFPRGKGGLGLGSGWWFEGSLNNCN